VYQPRVKVAHAQNPAEITGRIGKFREFSGKLRPEVRPYLLALTRAFSPLLALLQVVKRPYRRFCAVIKEILTPVIGLLLALFTRYLLAPVQFKAAGSCLLCSVPA